jgi:transposase InsO family protein
MAMPNAFQRLQAGGSFSPPLSHLREFLRAGEAWINIYNLKRPREGLDNLSPLQYVQQLGLEEIPSLALL